MTDGVKCVIGKATVVGRETVTVPAGTFDTYLVEPDLEHVGGVFKKSKDAKLKVWVTADERRIPVKVASRVVVGNFYAELERLSAPLRLLWPPGGEARRRGLGGLAGARKLKIFLRRPDETARAARRRPPYARPRARRHRGAPCPMTIP